MVHKAQMSLFTDAITMTHLGRTLLLKDVQLAFVSTPYKNKMPRTWVSLLDFPQATLENGVWTFDGLSHLPKVTVVMEKTTSEFSKITLKLFPKSGPRPLFYEGHRLSFNYEGQGHIQNRQSYFSYYSFAFNGVLPELKSPVKLYDGAPRVAPTNQTLYREPKGVAWWLTALKANSSKESLFLGAQSAEIFKTTFTICKNQTGHDVNIYQGLQGDYLPLQENKPLVADSILLSISDAILKTLENYGSWVAALNRPLLGHGPAKGWSSWYKYYPHINEDLLLDEARQMSGKLLPAGFELFQVDDGYQSKVGDWKNSEIRFPSGMQSLGEKLQGMGLKPGIWLAPFMADRNSEIAGNKKSQDWFLRDHEGRWLTYYLPGHSTNYIFDLTHPEVQSWLRETIRSYRKWGYTYLKIDFLFLAATAGKRKDPSVSALGAYRLGLDIIREEAGEATTLLLSGSLDLAAVGKAHANRLGPDIAYDIFDGHTRLAYIKAEMTATASHFFMGQRWFTPNVDGLMIRPPLKESLMEVMIAHGAMTSGDYILSDDLGSLSDERTRKLMDPRLLQMVNGRGNFIPLDYFSQAGSMKIAPNPLMLARFYCVPQIWLWSSPDKKQKTLFLYNLSADELKLDENLRQLCEEVYGENLLPEGQWKDLFHDRILKIQEGKIKIVLPPESVSVFPLV
jgi:hypothetical protein